MMKGDTMKKSWYIEAYTQSGAFYCRECVADTLKDDDFRDPYCTVEHDDFSPVFSSDIDTDYLDEPYCEYCFEPFGE